MRGTEAAREKLVHVTLSGLSLAAGLKKSIGNKMGLTEIQSYKAKYFIKRNL